MFKRHSSAKSNSDTPQPIPQMQPPAAIAGNWLSDVNSMLDAKIRAKEEQERQQVERMRIETQRKQKEREGRRAQIIVSLHNKLRRKIGLVIGQEKIYTQDSGAMACVNVDGFLFSTSPTYGNPESLYLVVKCCSRQNSGKPRDGRQCDGKVYLEFKNKQELTDILFSIGYKPGDNPEGMRGKMDCAQCLSDLPDNSGS